MTAQRADINGIFVPADDIVEVRVGEFCVAEHPKRLMTPALGSCVGVTLHDPVAQVGAMAHIMLPRPGDKSSGDDSSRFATVAIPEMVRLMIVRGAQRRRIVAKIAGGAAMFKGDSPVASIGDRNVAESKNQLHLMSIPLLAEDTGDGHARTIELELDTGVLVVRSYQFGVQRL